MYRSISFLQPVEMRLRTLIFCLFVVHLSALATRTYFPPVKPKAVYFTGAGIYFWWQAGCAKYLQEHCDLTGLPILGASAGSISATLLLSNADFSIAAESAIRIGQEAGVYGRKTGLAGIWGTLVKQWLEEMIPDTVNAKNFELLQVAVTPTTKSPKLINDLKGKADVIEALLASCHVPVFLDGRPTTMFRGEQVVDGSFWYFVTKDRVSGLPLPSDIPPEEIFWIDYCDDDDFMQAISGNILELVTPQRVLEMIDEGYNFMKREHYYGRLPMARFKKPNFVYTTDLVSGVETGVSNMMQWTDFLSPIRSSEWFGDRDVAAAATAATAAATASEREGVPIMSDGMYQSTTQTAVPSNNGWKVLPSFKIPTISNSLSRSLRKELKAWTSIENYTKYFPTSDEILKEPKNLGKYFADLKSLRFDDTVQ